MKDFLNHRDDSRPLIPEQRLSGLGVDVPWQQVTSTRHPMLFTVAKPTPVLLSVVAGYVDSCTYLGLLGVFVAQLTGSLVIAGTTIVRGGGGWLVNICAIISFFFSGVVITILTHSLREQPRRALALSLLVECILLIGLLVSCLAGEPFGDLDAPAAIVALLFGMAAMGAQSALVHLLMPGVASTNVMTMNTTRLATDSAVILLDWIERAKAKRIVSSNDECVRARYEIATLLPIWLGFLIGTAVGALAYVALGLLCVLFAIPPVGGLALWYMRQARVETNRPPTPTAGQRPRSN